MRNFLIEKKNREKKKFLLFSLLLRCLVRKIDDIEKERSVSQHTKCVTVSNRKHLFFLFIVIAFASRRRQTQCFCPIDSSDDFHACVLLNSLCLSLFLLPSLSLTHSLRHRIRCKNMPK